MEAGHSRAALSSACAKETEHEHANSHTARHLFCATCGVKSFYRPRSNPDGWSVNARCLDEPEVVKLDLTVFDGAHWEDHWQVHGAHMAQLSKETP